MSDQGEPDTPSRACEEGEMDDLMQKDESMPMYAGDENMGYNGKCGCSVARGWNLNEDLNKCCWCFPIFYCGFIWQSIGMILSGVNAASVLAYTWSGSEATPIKGMPTIVNYDQVAGGSGAYTLTLTSAEPRCPPAPTAQQKIIMTLNMLPFLVSGVMVLYYLACSKDREIPVKAVQL